MRGAMVEFPPRHPFLLRLAVRLLAKTERSVGAGPVRLTLDRREAPELHNQTDVEEQQRLVLLIEELCGSGWVSLRLGPPREFAGFADRNPQLELLNLGSLADWAGYIPKAQRWQRQWLEYLAAHWSEPGVIQPPDPRALLNYLARNPLLSLQDLTVLEATRSVETLLALCASGREIPLREASAHAFQGRSKILDNREELLRLLGSRPGQFEEAPIQLLLDIPGTFHEALFIENLVTFERMADTRRAAWRHSLLVYAAGFKGSARRLRSRQGCRLYVRTLPPSCAGRVRDDALLAVEEWLFAGASGLAVRFFGDLDYAGMQILLSLRAVFPDAIAWTPGYDVLVRGLEGGGGHTPVQASKEMQLDPESTGCPFADQQLLPLMRRCGRFIDQEAFDPERSEG